MIGINAVILAAPLSWEATRIGAALLLLIWVAALAVFSAREIRFLAGLEARLKRTCVIQHILMQVAVLLILLPCILASGPGVGLFAAILAGFGLLWLAGGWSVFTRYTYTSRILSEYRAAAMRSLKPPGDTEPNPSESGESK